MSASEQAVSIACGEHTAPGTLRMPAAEGHAPAAVLCHGLGSHRDEVGELFGRLARELGELGVASLRVDLPGHGAHPLPQAALSLTAAAGEIGVALAWLRAREDVDARRVALVGYSFGARAGITALATAQPPAAVALWAGALAQPADGTLGALRDAGAAVAARDGTVELDLGFRRWEFGTGFFGSLDAGPSAAGWVDEQRAPLLVVCGRDDDAVGASASLGLAAAARADTTVHLLAGADHVFNVLGPARDRSGEVIALTAAWLGARLRGDEAIDQQRGRTSWQSAA